MREIKFRAWDTRVSKWRGMWIFRGGHLSEKPHYDKPEILELNKSFSDYIIIMQYTGLKDKNGKEIYEGDILALCEDYKLSSFKAENDLRFVVGWEEEHAQFTKWSPREAFEIIGNKYENPELIEKA